MNDNLSDQFKLGVEVLLTGAILWSMVGMIQIVQNLGSTMSEVNVVSAKMLEYRQYNQFDNKDVYAQDIVSFIYQNRGLPFVYVKDTYKSKEYIWSESDTVYYPGAVRYTDYRAVVLTALIDQTKAYTANLITSPNGEVIGLTFITK